MINIIAACSKNNVIGLDGKIPWNLSEDQARFKQLTLNNVVIMGRKTFEEIFNKLGHPLPGRQNLIISTTKNFESENCKTFSSFEDALSYAKTQFPDKEIFAAGGESVYKKAMPLASRIYLTQLENQINGDRFFPEISLEDFYLSEKTVNKNNYISFEFLTFTRKSIIEE